MKPGKGTVTTAPAEATGGTVCGIVGIFHKGEARESEAQQGPVGNVLVPMCQDLHRRGPDSTGFALYHRAGDGTLVVRVDLDRPDLPNAAELTVIAAEQLVPVKEWELTARSLRLEVDSDGDGKLADWIEERIEGARVFSIGRAMEIIKDVGSAFDVDRTYGVRAMTGTHGIGHTRMATESRVDIAHSHPFWARPFPDIAVVHNGTITNYHQLRRRLEMKGHRFSTQNDSEVIAVYVADRLQMGQSLEDALKASITDLDGTFAYLISTDRGIGLARDQFATKPLLYAENDEMVVLSSEEVAIRTVFPDPELVPDELGAKEVRWWLR
jgi:methylamine---glutamate N-methyltransferase subunit A